MRAQISFVRLSYSACSSGVRFVGFLFAILVLHQSMDRQNVIADVREHFHDSCDVAMFDRRLDDRIVTTVPPLRKMSATDGALLALLPR
jgi:hypothetical protein